MKLDRRSFCLGIYNSQLRQIGPWIGVTILIAVTLACAADLINAWAYHRNEAFPCRYGSPPGLCQSFIKRGGFVPL
jgi:hypothetical protein